MKNYYLLFFLLSFSVSVSGQTGCGFDQLHESNLANPGYAKEVKERELFIQNFIAAKRAQRTTGTTAVYKIPVVVHVLHTGGAIGTEYNPSDEQIIAAINYLNQVFRGQYSSLQAPYNESSVVDLGIEFELAKRKPDICTPTNGIDRINLSSNANYVASGVYPVSGSGISNTSMMNLARWDPTKYYNIYVVNKISPNILGYASLPSTSTASDTDGTVLLASEMIAGKKTLPHELGHAFNLYHTFQGAPSTGACPDSGNGDYCDDTQPVSEHSGCLTGNNLCAPVIPATSPATYQQYNRNTESNFMSYTDCFTLFTTNQKERVQAAAAFASRNYGTTSLTACGPVINFSMKTMAIQEANNASDGCRYYKDYTVKLLIGAAPSAPADLLLTFGGTAVKGVDYDVTTNNNFTTPSNILTFPTASSASQSFTLRIYDDSAVEPNETILLGFSLNSNAGDAVQGTDAPQLEITLSDNDTAPYGAGSGLITVGGMVPPSYFDDGNPLDARVQKRKVQLVYTAAELRAAGVYPGSLTSLALFVLQKASTRSFSNLTIKLANIEASYLLDISTLNTITGATTVYTAASYSTVLNWNTFTFSTPFTWTGGNLAVELCYDNGSADTSQGLDKFAAYTDTNIEDIYNFLIFDNLDCGSGTNVSAISSGYAQGYRPQIRLNYSTTGTPVETLASGSSTNFISSSGSNALNTSEYFYSNGKIVAGIAGSNANLGCVTATVEEAGTTWKSITNGTRSAKVFLITPSQNNSTATYTVSFFFTTAELGSTPTSKIKLAKTTASSAATANSSNTVYLTPTITALGSGGYVISGTFVGFSRFFLTNTEDPLPVTLANFTAKPTESNTILLEWQTTSEVNFERFELERSLNPLRDYKLIASIAPANGQSKSGYYSYPDLAPYQGVTNYYRLKMIDKDGTYAYSKIVATKTKSLLVTVAPNPAHDWVNIIAPAGLSEIQLLNREGKTILSKKIEETDSYRLALPQLSPGIYLLTIRAKNGQSEHHKIIIE